MSDIYVLIKRDLYERPEHQGYTGIKDLAGAWPLSLVQSETVPVKDKYDRSNHGHYALPIEAAPDFTSTCFHDLAQAHLEKKIAAKDAEIEKLTDRLDIGPNGEDAVVAESAVEHLRHRISVLERTMAPFRAVAGRLFETNANASDVVFEGPHITHMVDLTAGDFFAVAAALKGDAA